MHKRKVSGKVRFFKGALNVFVAVAIFGLGYGIGGGKLQFRNYSAVSSNSDLPTKLDYSSVDTIYKSLRENFDGELDEDKLMDGIKNGLAKATGDPYTQYLNAEGAKEFTESITGTFSGIGARLTTNDSDRIMVETPLAGYPAEKAGLKAKDLIIEIDDESSVDYTVSEAVEKIRGDAGTKVKLKVIRDDKEVLDFEITRQTINIPSVENKVIDGNIGYIQVLRFDDDTGDLARKAALEFKSKGINKIILDLRNNPGGYLSAAVELSSLWLKPGTTVLTERRDNQVISTEKASGDALLSGVKTVVLINEGSASASEITAGALKDNNVATLIGQKSYGKGSVQQPINLGNGGILKVTIARWFTPAGNNIDKEGISPDTKVDISAEDIKAGRDPQLDAGVAAF